MKSSVCLLRWRQNSEEGGPAFHFLHGVNRNTSDEQLVLELWMVCFCCEQFEVRTVRLSCERSVCALNNVFPLWSVYLSCERSVCALNNVFPLWSVYLCWEQCVAGWFHTLSQARASDVCRAESSCSSTFIVTLNLSVLLCAEQYPPAP